MTTHDRDKVIAAARESQLAYQSDVMLSLDELEAFYAIAHEAGRVAEREECAKVCDEIAEADNGYWCAMTIRARGDTK